MHNATTVWVVTEEIESGIYASGETYLLLSTHQTEKGADDACVAWREAHEGDSDEEHGFVAEEDGTWCGGCGCSVTVEAVKLLP